METMQLMPSSAERETELEGRPPSYPPRIVSGLEPMPALHLGHYFGAVKDLLRLQHEYPGDTFFLIADQHALSRGVMGGDLTGHTVGLVTALLALGLDPSKTILYRQSDIPACAELVWYVSCVLPIAELMAGAPYRQMLESAEGGSAGSLLYPLLMAADVLCVRGTCIQVGADQRLNAEIVRHIARHLNGTFGWELFPIPQVLYSGEDDVPGSDGRRMSFARDNHIGLFEPFYRLQKQVRRIEPGNPRDPDSCIAYRLYSLVASPEERQAAAESYRREELGSSEIQRRLIGALQEHFAVAESRYHELKEDPDFVLDVLREGVRQAREEVEETLELVRELLGLAA